MRPLTTGENYPKHKHFSLIIKYFFLLIRIFVDTDAAVIVSRVSRPDTTEIVINEQTILSACRTVKEKMQQRIGQL